MPHDFQWRPPVDREITEELAFHVEMRTRELIAGGMDPVLARAEAIRKLGDLNGMRKKLSRLGKGRNRMRRRTEWWSELWSDVRFGIRTLTRQPGFTSVALLTLAVGIGATTAIFSVLNTVVLRPLPVLEPDRLVVVSDYFGDQPGGDVSAGTYFDLGREQRVFSGLAASYFTNFIVTGSQEPERIVGSRATASYFRVFEVPPLHGRAFREDEDSPGQSPVAVLSHRFWVRRFGGDPGVLGQTIILNTMPHLIIGVMPARFDFFANSGDLWTPAAFTNEQKAQHDGRFLRVYGRLKAEVTPEQAVADLTPIAARLRELHPDANANLRVAVTPIIEAVVGNTADRILVVFGAVCLVLLIGCVNVANLLLARGATRARELAVRAALGAGRSRIVRQLLVENLVLSLVAGILGVGVAGFGVRVILAAAPENVPRLDRLSLDLASVGFALAAAVASALVFGVLPAVRTAGTDLFSALREGSRGASGTTRDWLKRGLVAAEVALAMLLLVGAGLLIRTAIHLGRIDPGFDPRGVLSARVSLPRASYQAWERVTTTFTRLAEDLSRRPGVVAAGVVSQVPMGPGGNSNGLIPEGKSLEGRNAILSRHRLVSRGYFRTMRIPLRQGREFDADDHRGQPRVMIVNETLARTAFPGPSPIGKQMACCEIGEEGGSAWKEIVGVVADVPVWGLEDEAEPEFYLPIGQAPPAAWEWVARTMTVAIRTEGEPSAMAPTLREVVRAIDPTLPVFQVAAMDKWIAQSLAESRFNTQLLTTLGAIGLLLAAVGIYGVIAFFVARRTREIGIRSALGASRGAVRGLVLRQGLIPVAIGVGAGLIGSLAASGVIASQLRGVPPHDPVTLAIVAIGLLAIAVVAILAPARAATRIDPTIAMREE